MTRTIRDFIAVPFTPPVKTWRPEPKEELRLHPLEGYDAQRTDNQVMSVFGYPAPKPQMDVAMQRIRTIEQAGDGGGGVADIEVLLGDLRCGSFKRLRGLSFNFGGVQLPLTVFHHANQAGTSFDPPFYAGLHRLDRDGEIYVVGNLASLGKQTEKAMRPVICLDFSSALVWHLSLCRAGIWPDGTVVEQQ